MRQLVAVILLMTVMGLTSWTQEKNNDYIIMDVDYVMEHAFTCEMDTTILYHENSEFVILDSSEAKFDFVTGTTSYFEIVIKTTVCPCKDCSFTERIIVQRENQDTVISLNTENTTWTHQNVWRIRPFVSPFFGTLDLNNHQLSLDQNHPEFPEISLGKTEFRHEALELKN